MKKILFNSRYGLETAVIERRKTMTRREVKLPDGMKRDDVRNPVMGIDENGRVYFTVDCVDGKQRDIYPLYQIGEVVAVGQTYERAGWKPDTLLEAHFVKNSVRQVSDLPISQLPGWRNKMFTYPTMMPWQVQMTDLWFEHLQDISDEDCMREGVERWLDGYIVSGLMERSGRNNRVFDTPRAAFAALIDRINGRGTWQDNPWVVAYTMDLQRAEGFKEQETNK